MLSLLSSSVAMMLAMVMATSERDGAYERPADAFLSGSIRSCAEKALSETRYTQSQRSLANGRALIPGDVDNGHGNACGFETMSQLDA